MRAEHLPWAVLYRIPIGYGIIPLSTAVFGVRGLGWGLAVMFLVVLAALRVGPGILRRGLPCSNAIKTIWGERRVLARRYDSYQWRKMLGLGLGMALYLALAHELSLWAVLLAGGSVIGGAAGVGLWHRHSAEVPKSSPLV